jgi:ATP-binding cassette subfamily C (CFTR/MRP) protein 1
MIIAVYTVVQLVLLIEICKTPVFTNPAANASAALAFLTGFIIAGLSYLEHSRSLRPSIILTTYLLFTILFDAALSRTLLMISPSWLLGRLHVSAVGIKAFILLLECIPKARWEISPPKQRSPETTIGIFSIVTFAWLRRLFVLGNRKLLDVDDLPMLDETMTPEKLDSEFWDEWSKPTRHGRDIHLALALVKALGWRFLIPIPGRLAKVGFDFCQPLLINRVQTFLLTPNSSAREGKALIGATVLVYSGIAISMAVFRYFHMRNVALVRGFLVSGIFRKTTILKLGADEHKASLTLMTTDVERCRLCFSVIHELWSNIIEFALAAWLLERQLGIAFLLPVGVVSLCFIGSISLGKYMPKYNKAWVAATQHRVGATANVIANMKSLKMTGLTVQLGNLIQRMREKEIKAGNAYRITTVLATLFAFAPSIVSPVLTFATTNRDINTSRAFTSLSYLVLLTQPLSQLFQIIPMLIASITCLDRIAAYLDTESWTDYRTFESETPLSSKEDSQNSELTEKHLDAMLHHNNSTSSKFAFIIRNGSFGWSTGKFVLHNIDIAIPTAQLTMVIGPVGSGKSTLCKTLLGEIPSVQGQVICGSKLRAIGFCDQTPFLPDASIRDVIIGCVDFDESWYKNVIEATALTSDINTFTNGDLTKVGPNGSSLSGGQRHRIAIARAIYARPSTLIFDDIFSGLDGPTEQIIFRKVFSEEGVLQQQNCTIILCTHSVKQLPFAHHIIALGVDGTVVEQGSFAELSSNANYVQSLNIEAVEKSTFESSERHGGISESSIANTASKGKTDDRTRQLGDLSVYKVYFATAGTITIVVFIISTVSFGFCNNFSTVWVEFWSRYNTAHPNDKSKQGYYLGLYGLIQSVSLVSITAGVSSVELLLAARSGKQFHLRAIQTVMAAPLSLFTATPPGVILNRFSQDLTILDSELAMSVISVSFTFSIAVGIAAVVATASPYVAACYPILFIVLYILQKYYLRTSRQLRYLDLETKSPLM